MLAFSNPRCGNETLITENREMIVCECLYESFRMDNFDCLMWHSPLLYQNCLYRLPMVMNWPKFHSPWYTLLGDTFSCLHYWLIISESDRLSQKSLVMGFPCCVTKFCFIQWSGLSNNWDFGLKFLNGCIF